MGSFPAKTNAVVSTALPPNRSSLGELLGRASCTHPARTHRGGPDAWRRSRGNWAPLWFQVTSDYRAGLCSPKWSCSPPPTVWWPPEGPHCDSSCKPAAVSTPVSFRSKPGTSGEALLNPSSGCCRRPRGTAAAYNLLPSRACLPGNFLLFQGFWVKLDQCCFWGYS